MTEARSMASNWIGLKETFTKLLEELGNGESTTSVTAKTMLTPEDTNLKIRFCDEDGDVGTITVPGLDTLLEYLDEFVMYDFEEENMRALEEEEEEKEEEKEEESRYATEKRYECTCKTCSCKMDVKPEAPTLKPIIVDSDGFLLSYVPNHPEADVTGYYPTHRLVLESYLKSKNQYAHLVTHPTHPSGKWYIDPYTPVVFLDGDKKNIQVSNLAIIPEELNNADVISRLVELNRIVIDDF